jgi:uncharacterized membrane protein
MNLTNLVSGPIGAIHFAASILAMALGLYVLLTPKGTKRHRKMGYSYVASMLVLNLTAFLIYRLFGRFGVFHWLAVVSLLTLLGGLLPVITRKPKDYIVTHFSFMYWSVVGLYAAFMAETFVRLPKIVLTASGEPMVIFYKMVGWAVGLTIAVGVFFFLKNRGKWTTEFGQNSGK